MVQRNYSGQNSGVVKYKSHGLFSGIREKNAYEEMEKFCSPKKYQIVQISEAEELKTINTTTNGQIYGNSYSANSQTTPVTWGYTYIKFECEG